MTRKLLKKMKKINFLYTIRKNEFRLHVLKHENYIEKNILKKIKNKNVLYTMRKMNLDEMYSSKKKW